MQLRSTGSRSDETLVDSPRHFVVLSAKRLVSLPMPLLNQDFQSGGLVDHSPPLPQSELSSTVAPARHKRDRSIPERSWMVPIRCRAETRRAAMLGRRPRGVTTVTRSFGAWPGVDLAARLRPRTGRRNAVLSCEPADVCAREWRKPFHLGRREVGAKCGYDGVDHRLSRLFVSGLGAPVMPRRGG